MMLEVWRIFDLYDCDETAVTTDSVSQATYQHPAGYFY